MIRITDTIALPDGEVRERFVRSVGPAGENRNKRVTAAELRMNIAASSLPADVKRRLVTLGGRHVTKDGVLIVVSREYPSQLRNREAARAMLVALIKRAVSPGRKRVASEPSRAVRQSWLDSKERASELKQSRRKGPMSTRVGD